MFPLAALKMTMGPGAGGPDAQLAGVLGKIPAQDLAGLGKGSAIGDLEKIAPSGLPQQGLGAVESGGGSFTQVLGQMVGEVNAKQAAAGEAVNGLLGGGNVSLHQAMIAMEEANVSFQLMIEVRNKLLDSYQELMRMQV